MPRHKHQIDPGLRCSRKVTHCCLAEVTHIENATEELGTTGIIHAVRALFGGGEQATSSAPQARFEWGRARSEAVDVTWWVPSA